MIFINDVIHVDGFILKVMTGCVVCGLGWLDITMAMSDSGK